MKTPTHYVDDNVVSIHRRLMESSDMGLSLDGIMISEND